MKKILMMTALVAMAFAAKADYLYWQIGNYDSATSGTSSAYNSVSIWATTKGDGAVWSKDYERLSGYEAADPTQTYETYFDSSKNYTNYFIELSNYENGTRTSVAGTSGSWESLSGAVSKSMQALASVTAYSGASGYGAANVPEPTSGLMLMLGLALMGLKRKRA